MKIKRNCIFVLNSSKDPISKLKYRITWEGNMVSFGAGYMIEPDKWVKEAQRCKNNTSHGKKKVSAATINRVLSDMEKVAEETFQMFESKGQVPAPDDFRDTFNILNGKTTRTTLDKCFFDIYDEFTREMGRANQWTVATYQKFNALKNHLTNYDQQLTFDKLDENGLMDYVIYMRDSLNMRNSTIGKQLGFIKWFLKWASNKKYTTDNAFRSFSPKLKSTTKKVIFLEWDELMTIYNFNIPPNGTEVELKSSNEDTYIKQVKEAGALAKVRDVFCFCCFTSLRYSDAANLKRTDVFDDHISITTVKTADALTIELNDFSRAILDKHKNESFANNRALPVISNQKMNNYLKELCELCELNRSVTITYYKGNQRFDEVWPLHQMITTHAGRRTFICNALSMGIAPQIVMKWTGHSDYSAMKPYIDIAETVKSEAMSKFNHKSPTLKKGD